MDCGNENYGPRVDPMSGVECYERMIYQDYDKRIKKEIRFSAPDLYYCNKDAIVTVNTTTYDDNGDEHLTQGSGAFFGPCLIVTAASLLIYNNSGTDRSPPAPSNVFASRVQKITVRVSNVNGEGVAYFYEAKLLGFSPTFNIGVIQIDNIQRQACAAPPIRKSPILEWGCSRKTVIGEDVVVISNNYDAPTVGISKGIVVDNLYTQKTFTSTSGILTTATNNVEVEGIVTDATILDTNIGGPLLDMHGRVIGIVTGQIDSDGVLSDTGRNWTYAVSEHIARRVVAALSCQRNDKKLAGHINFVEDLLGAYRTYNFGWLGLTEYYAFGPQTLRIVPDSKYLKQKGYIVVAVDGNGPLNTVFTNIYVNNSGSDKNPDPVTESDELYLITQVNGSDVGIGPGQIPLSSITFLEIPEMQVVLNYRLGSEKFSCPRRACIQLGQFPTNGDVPPPYSWTRSLPSSRGALIQANEELDRGLNFGLMFDRFKSHITSPSFIQYFLDALRKFMSPSSSEASFGQELAGGVTESELENEARARGIPDDIIKGILKMLTNESFLKFLVSKLESLIQARDRSIEQAEKTEPL